MDRKTRKELEQILERLTEIASLETDKAERMGEYFDGEKYDRIEETADFLQDAVRSLEEALDR